MIHRELKLPKKNPKQLLPLIFIVTGSKYGVRALLGFTLFSFPPAPAQEVQSVAALEAIKNPLRCSHLILEGYHVSQVKCGQFC